MAILRTLGLILLFVCLSPLILAFVLLAMVAVTVLTAYAWIALRWQSWRSGVRCYLVCSSRRGWNEFVENNLLAALPPGVAPVWTGAPSDVLSRMALESLFSRGAGVPKPYLAEVRPLGIRICPLHERLLPLKTHGYKDAELQGLLRDVLQRELEVSA
jgi:hypothetical protein